MVGHLLRTRVPSGLGVAGVSIVLQMISGDFAAQRVAKYQPAKLAAMEGLFKTQKGAPFTVFGIPDEDSQENSWGIEIPYLLSFLAFHDFNAEVKGLDLLQKREQCQRICTVHPGDVQFRSESPTSIAPPFVRNLLESFSLCLC